MRGFNVLRAIVLVLIVTNVTINLRVTKSLINIINITIFMLDNKITLSYFKLEGKKKSPYSVW